MTKKNKNPNTKILWLTVFLFMTGIILGFSIGIFGIGLQNTKTTKTTTTNTTTPTTTISTNDTPVLITEPQSTAKSEKEAEITTSQILEDSGAISKGAGPTDGSETATISIVEFGDYQCTYCKRYFEEDYTKIMENYVKTGKVAYTFRDFPLTSHPQSLPAALTANCANEQGKFWEMHDMLYEKQNLWSYKDNFKDTFISFAKDLKLDEKQFKDCLEQEKYIYKIQKDIKDGVSYKIIGTPTIFIEKSKIVGAQPYTTFKAIIDQELKKAELEKITSQELP